MSIYDTLNEKQREAVFTTEGPLLLLAGAGSGKTRVLTHRIAYLIENNGVNPWNILAITFTNKAAGEMRDRVDKIVGFGSESVWVSTFHSTCVRILRRHIDLIGFGTNFTIYDTDDQKSIMKEVIKKLELDPKQYKERSFLSTVSSAKDELISPEEYKRNVVGDFRKEKVALAYLEYQNTLQKNNALDFDDIIVKTIELFKLHPEILDNYQERFRYIMVDEYQDTNTAQFELIHLLAKKYKNLCVVGDDDQSIYKFRGANIHNILDFENVFKEAKVIKLEQNYRSTQNILDAANKVIKNNTARKDKNLWTDKGEGNKIHFRQFETAYEEAEFIASEIAKGKKKGLFDYKQCAVLYRTNAQSRILEEQFIREGVPYNVVGGTNFYSRREIKDILAYLKTIDNANDDLQVKRIINIPKRGIGATTIVRVQEFADQNGINFYDALKDADEIKTIGKSASKIHPFVNMIQVFRAKLSVYSLKELINDLLENTQYIKLLEDSDDEDADDRIENINEFVSKIVSFEEEHENATLSSFLEEVALVSAIDSVDDEDNRTLLMTLHAAKGLEFDRVYLAGTEDGIFPSYMSIMDEDPTAIEEERRLAYVGITRAKEELNITCAKMRMIHGETQYNAVSRFIREIPSELMDNQPMKERARDFDIYAEDSTERNQFKAKPYERPKAILRERQTDIENKPFIARGIASLQMGNNIQKGLLTANSLSYEIGDRVSHIKYGEGTVKSIEKEPRDFRVTVEFDQAGQKIMYAAFAKLIKV